MRSNLMPCPFCGSDQVQVYDNSVVCEACGGSLDNTTGYNRFERDEAQTIAAWNTRTQQAMPVPEHESLDRILEGGEHA